MDNMEYNSRLEILVYHFRVISNFSPSVRPIPLTETCSYTLFNNVFFVRAPRPNFLLSTGQPHKSASNHDQGNLQ